jgi:hypothetical protein
MDPWAINHSSSVRGAAPRVLCSASRSMRSRAITGSVTPKIEAGHSLTRYQKGKGVVLLRGGDDRPNRAEPNECDPRQLIPQKPLPARVSCELGPAPTPDEKLFMSSTAWQARRLQKKANRFPAESRAKTSGFEAIRSCSKRIASNGIRSWMKSSKPSCKMRALVREHRNSQGRDGVHPNCNGNSSDLR